MSKQIGEATPIYIWSNGRVIPWDEATVHVCSELAIRGANVFEGIRGYWDEDNACYQLLALDTHLRRLNDSARIMRFPPHLSDSEFRGGIEELLQWLDYRTDVYVRPTVYVEFGRYGASADTVQMGAYIAIFANRRDPKCSSGARLCVSSWQRATDLSDPPRVKGGASYQPLRLPLHEATRFGFDDAILMNARGTVAETTSAALFVVRGDEVATPPVTAGILESVTARLMCEMLQADFGVRVIQREIDRTELYVADEVFMAGTLREVQPVIQIDDVMIGDGAPGDRTRSWQRRFFEICAGADQKKGWLTPLARERAAVDV